MGTSICSSKYTSLTPTMTMSLLRVATVFCAFAGVDYASSFVLPRPSVRLPSTFLKRTAADDLDEATAPFREAVKFILVPQRKRKATPTYDSTTTSSPDSYVVDDPSDTGLIVPDEVELTNVQAESFDVPEPPMEIVMFPEPTSAVGGTESNPLTVEKIIDSLLQPVLTSAPTSPSWTLPGFAKSDKIPDLPPVQRPPLVENTIQSMRQQVQTWQSAIQDNSPREPGTAPSLLEYLEDKWAMLDLQKAQPPDLKTMTLPSFEVRMPRLPVEAFSSSLEQLRVLVQQQDYSLTDVLAALNLGELGPWYGGVIGLLLLMSLGTIASNSGEVEADTPSLVPATQSAPDAESNENLKRQIAELASAASNLSSELTKLKSEKVARDYEVATMKSELRTLQYKVDASQQSERVLQKEIARKQEEIKELGDVIQELEAENVRKKEELAALSTKMAELEKTTTESAQRALEEHFAEIDLRCKEKERMEAEISSLQARLTESQSSFILEKEQLEERLQQVTNDAELVSTLQSEKDGLTLENERLSVKVSELQQLLDTLSADLAKIPLLEEEKRYLQGQADRLSFEASELRQELEDLRALTTKSEVITSESNLPFEIAKELSKFVSNGTVDPEPTFSLVEDTSDHAEKAKLSGASKRGPKASKDKANDDVNDWSSFSQSALNKKTLKDLQEYLAAKGAAITDDEGKPLKKAALVELVQSM